MKKTTFENIINTLATMSDVRLLDDYKAFSDDKIQSCDAIHFEFIQLNMTDDKARRYNKRMSVKAKSIVVNQSVAKHIADNDAYTVKRHYIASSKNYADIVAYENVSDMLAIVRNAHYESIAQALENAFEIEVKTNASKKSRKAKKDA